jgi:arylsulfatase A-like enzyme
MVGLTHTCMLHSRILIFWLGVVFPVVGFSAATSDLANGRRPNVLLILADDLGYGDLGCYGQTRIKTPHIDKLAAEGIRFTDFYAGSTVCAPSRCALMTGLHTGHCWIRGNGKTALRREDITLADILKAKGYYNCLIGKWGLGNEDTTGMPQKKGFDEFVGYLDQTHAHDYYTDRLWHFAPKNQFDGWQYFPENQGGEKQVYMPDLFTMGATNFIRINKPDQFNQFRPFFLFLSTTIPHANNEEGNRSGNGMQVPTSAPYSDESWPAPEKNKAAMITRLDADIGNILARLKELKIEDNTIIIFSSDNGPHQEGGVNPSFFKSAGPLRGSKRDLYEGGIRVPLIVRWPARIKPAVSSLPAASWDLLPTIAELSGATYNTNLDGISFAPTLLNLPQTNRHEYLYWEFHERGFKQAVRMGEWKAVRPKAGAALELYNLKEDLAETKNVADQNREIAAKIENYLKTARTDSAEWPIKTPGG